MYTREYKELTMAVSVDHLIRMPFLHQNLGAKIAILQNGRPRPLLNEFRVYEKNSDRFYKFDKSIYDRIQWLTGCDIRQKLFCWPCLLFNSPNCWNSSEMNGAMLKQKIEHHQADTVHITVLLAMQMFINSINPKLQISDMTFNSLVKRNRTILKGIIDTVCYLLLQKRHLNKESQDKNQLSVKECVEAWKFLREHGISDGNDVTIAEDALFVLQKSKNLVNHIVDAITQCAKLAIGKETRASSFVSIILSGHETVSPLVRRSIVLRYLKNNKVCERFVGFHEVNVASHDDFFENISKVVSDFQLLERVLSLSVDGTFPEKLLCAIEKELSSTYPYTTSVPCYFHKFRDVLQQSLSVVKGCDSFFKMMSQMVAFFQNDPADLECFLNGKVSGAIKFGSVNTPGTLNLFKRLRKPLREYCNFILKNCDKRKREDCMKAYTFSQFLSEFSSAFWMELFIRLFRVTNDISEMLDSSMPETVFEEGEPTIEKLSTALVSEKEWGFDNFWSDIMDYLSKDMADQIRNIDKQEWRDRFINVVKCVEFQVKVRLRHLKTFGFYHLLNPSKFNPIFTIPHELVAQLDDKYKYIFPPKYVEKEIRTLYPNNKSIIGYSVQELLEYLNSDCRKANFMFLIKLAKLVLTMPCKSPSDTHSSVLDKISVFSRFSAKSGDYSLLCIETELFREIRRKESFHDDVIREFHKLSDSMQLLQYKA